MQIVLCEDDGLFNNGVPKNVILHVTFDDEREIRVPYSADKPISELYKDLRKISNTNGHLPKIEAVRHVDGQIKAIQDPLPVEVVINNGKIEKEDIVTLIKLEDREGATCPLQLGNQYRVIGIKAVGITKPGESTVTSIVQTYDIVDDSSPRPERIVVFPHEVQLFRKRTPQNKAPKPAIEEILTCPKCAVENSLALDKDTFKGRCIGCGLDIKIKRIIRKCTNKKCKAKVSLFESDGAFKGQCPECNASVAEGTND